MGTYRLRIPASRVGYVPEAQGGLPPGPRVLYVRGTRTSLRRWVRTAYRGTPGCVKCPPCCGCTNCCCCEEEIIYMDGDLKPMSNLVMEMR